MTATRLLLAILPAAIMIAAMALMSGFEHRLAALGTSAKAKLMLGRVGIALPYIAPAAIGVVALFAANGSTNIKVAGMSVLAGGVVAIIIAMTRETIRLAGIASDVPPKQSVLTYIHEKVAPDAVR
ncbi:type IV secretion system protein VirD4 [Rhizobium sp. NFACC06-2]|nr:type IV secretion system protein VirD4 [Rhizobium sp. NFACC06-2]